MSDATSTAELPSIGTPFGKYELLAKIGLGGMAEIYKARVSGIQGFTKTLVVKKILPSYAKNTAFIDLLVAEAKVSSLLQHGNVVQIFELGEVEGQYYIAMEYVDGCDLLKLLTSCTKRKERIPQELCLFVIGEAAKGLGYAHEATDDAGRPLKIVHRDVSPSNVLVSRQGDVKVMDFGVARADLEASASDGGSQRKGGLKGKLGYMSPELVTGGEIDHRSDIFALGIILWEVLTLRRLFVGKSDVQTLINIRDVRVERKFKRHDYLSDGIQAIIRKALAKDPDDRFQTASEFHEAILDYLFENRLRVTSRTLAEFAGEHIERIAATTRADADPGAPEPAGEEEGEVTPKAEVDADVVDAEVDAEVEVEAPQPRRTEQQTEPNASLVAEVALAIEGEEHDARVEAPEPAQPPQPVTPPPERGEAESALKGATFRLKSGGLELGPITYGNLVSLLQSRSFSPDELVSIDGQPWLPLASTSVRHLAPDAFVKESDLPLYEGPVSRIKMPQLLYELWLARVSGKLRLTHGDVRKEIFFQKGQPMHVHSNLKSELLAAFMKERDLLDDEQAAQALQHVKGSEGRLGDSLVALGYVRPHDLYRVLEMQFRERLLGIFTWDHGWYAFLAGYPAPPDTIPLGTDAIELLTLGVRTKYDLADLERMFAVYADRMLIMQSNQHLTHNNLRFNSRELRFYTYLETGTTLRDNLDRFGRTADDRRTLMQVVFVLHQTDLLAFQSPSLMRPRGGARVP